MADIPFGNTVSRTGAGNIEISAAGTKGVITAVTYTGGGTCQIENAAGGTVLVYVGAPGLMVPFRFLDGARIVIGTAGSATAIWAPIK